MAGSKFQREDEELSFQHVTFGRPCGPSRRDLGEELDQQNRISGENLGRGKHFASQQHNDGIESYKTRLDPQHSKSPTFTVLRGYQPAKEQPEKQGMGRGERGAGAKDTCSPKTQKHCQQIRK